jgi:Bifunctional DNA primase/polymerase, N-terminal
MMHLLRLMRAALGLASRGWFVFPPRVGDKRPLPHFTQWEKRATRDRDQIYRWWSQSPYNIGIATGRSNLLVVDCDVPKDTTAAHGAYNLARLARQAGEPLPLTLTVLTPSGGVDYYFAAPRETNLGNTVGRLAPNVDTRGIGGYVVAPGSQTRKGIYRIIAHQSVQDMPGWITARLVPPPPPRPQEMAPQTADRYLAKILQAEASRVASAAVGSRNNSLNAAAFALGQLIGGGEISEGIARSVLEDAVAVHIGMDGFSRGEAERTMTSGLTAGMRHPRRLRRR